MTGDVINMEFPLRGAYILPIRLAVSGVATRLGMTVDELEDLRTAVSEACICAMDGLETGTLQLRLEIEPEHLCVQIQARGEGAADSVQENEALEISRLLVESLSAKSDFDGRRIALWFTI